MEWFIKEIQFIKLLQQRTKYSFDILSPFSFIVIEPCNIYWGTWIPKIWATFSRLPFIWLNFWPIKCETSGECNFFIFNGRKHAFIISFPLPLAGMGWGHGGLPPWIIWNSKREEARKWLSFFFFSSFYTHGNLFRIGLHLWVNLWRNYIFIILILPF